MRGREVFHGNLCIPKGSSGKKQRAEVYMYCTAHGCQYPVQIEVFKECYKNYQKPKKVLPLSAIREQGLQEGQPQVCYGLSPAQKSPLILTLSLSEKASSHGQATYMLFSFHIHLKNGEMLDFYAPIPKEMN